MKRYLMVYVVNLALVSLILVAFDSTAKEVINSLYLNAVFFFMPLGIIYAYPVVRRCLWELRS